MWPSIVEKDERGTERVFDLVSRLLKDRIILVNGEINSGSAASVIAQLLYLEADDSKAPITVISTALEDLFLTGLPFMIL